MYCVQPNSHLDLMCSCSLTAFVVGHISKSTVKQCLVVDHVNLGLAFLQKHSLQELIRLGETVAELTENGPDGL